MFVFWRKPWALFFYCVQRAEMLKPWRGLTDKFKPVQKEIMSHFGEKAVEKNQMEDAEMIKVTGTKYWVKLRLEVRPHRLHELPEVVVSFLRLS